MHTIRQGICPPFGRTRIGAGIMSADIIPYFYKIANIYFIVWRMLNVKRPPVGHVLLDTLKKATAGISSGGLKPFSSCF